MAHRGQFLLVGVLAAFVYGAAVGQSLDEILAKHFQARGGLEKIKAVQTIHAQGKMMRQGMEFPFTMMQKKPKKMRSEFTVQGQKIVQAYDGTAGWFVNPLTGSSDPQDTPQEATEQLDEQADLDGVLVDWKEKGHTVELVGKEEVEGTDAYNLKVTLKNGKVRNIYIDADSFLELKQKAKMTAQGREIETESYPGSYKAVNGLMVPFSVESKISGQVVGQMVMDTVIVNGELPDSLFVKPGTGK